MSSEFRVDLNSKVAIVTGGGQGLGLSFGKCLGFANCKVILVDKNAETGRKAEKALIDLGFEAAFFGSDVSRQMQVDDLVKWCLDKFHRIDVLVNCAGVIIRKEILEYSEEEWNVIFDTNLKGTYLCSKSVGKVMREQLSGRIINIASIGAFTALDSRGAYCASKAGVTQLTKVMALELAKYNVRVNAIAPGVVSTPLNKEFLAYGTERYYEHINRIPVGRFAQPEDLNGILLYLASDASDYMTGQTIYIDGGWTLT
jgi:NAD(P)-dependent dehydrogenase (short-subunit alcohol dehydrogenase family)